MYLTHGKNETRKWSVIFIAVVLFVGIFTVIPNTGSIAIAATDADTIEIPNPPAIYGDVFNDLNRDGVYQWPTPEYGVEGVTVKLEYQGASGTSTQTVTDANGYYWFKDLTEFGTYTLSVVLPAGYSATTATAVNIEISGAGSVEKHQFGITEPDVIGWLGALYRSVAASGASTADSAQ